MARQGHRSRTRSRRRLRLWQAQGGRCFWCGRTMTLIQPAETSATFEHLFPHGHAVRIQPWAIVLACRRCNERRAQAPWETFWRECQAEHARYAQSRGEVSLWGSIRS